VENMDFLFIFLVIFSLGFGLMIGYASNLSAEAVADFVCNSHSEELVSFNDPTDRVVCADDNGRTFVYRR